jgi:hypothetical protein
MIKNASWMRAQSNFQELLGRVSHFELHQVFRSLEKKLVLCLTAEPAKIPVVRSKDALWVAQALWGEGSYGGEVDHLNLPSEKR